MLLGTKMMKDQMVVAMLTILVGAAVRPAQAQQPIKPMPRIGFISPAGSPTTPSAPFNAFRSSLQDLGYIDGKTVAFEQRYAEGRLDRIPTLVDDLVQQKVDLLFVTNNVAIRAAREATKSIPIVMITTVDPVAAGYVDSISRPGGNTTGLATLTRDLSAKRVELLRELLPKMTRLGVLWDGDAPGPKIAFKQYIAAARAFKLDLRSLEVHGPTPDLPVVMHNAKTAQVDALLVVGNPMIAQFKKQLFELAIKNRFPSMTEERHYVDDGGMISYGASSADLHTRAAEYVVAILKGAKAADLPVKMATRFETFVNLKTSKQMGLVIPQHILVQADKVIQ